MSDFITSLNGVRVLVARPDPQGAAFSSLVKAQGGRAVSFPVLDICPADDAAKLTMFLKDKHRFDLCVLVSLSAIEFLAKVLDGEKSPISMPPVAVMGDKSAKKCAQLGIPVSFMPTNSMDSEGLLTTLSSVNLKNKRVAILRGQSGRELLKDQIEAMGASVEYIDVYKRVVTTRSPRSLIEKWKTGGINVVLVTSNAIVDGLLGLLGDESGLFHRTPVVTISDRIARYCELNGVHASIHVASSPADQDVIHCLSGLNKTTVSH